MSITISGLASGLDVNAIIDGLVKAESVPLTSLKTKQSQVQAASTTITSIQTKLGALRAAATALADPVQFSSYAATSSDSAVVASVSGAPTKASYDITVDSIAAEQRTYSDLQDSATDALAMAGTLTIQAGAAAGVDVNVVAGDSLSAIASKINSSGARVSASVLYDGTKYRLQVRGADTGEANAVNFTESGFSLGLSSYDAATDQKAADAKIHIDGIEVKRSTNQLVGVIPGVTLAVTKKTTSAATIAVSQDPAALANKIGALVKAYNDVVTTSHTASGYGQSTASNPMLAGDGALRGMLDKLQRVIGSPVTGASGKYSTMLAVGLESNRDGTLTLNQTKLNAAIAADPTSVSKLFVVDAKTASTGAMGTMQTVIDSLTVGKYAALQNRIDALDARSRDMDAQSAAIQRRIDGYQAKLQAQFSALEKIMTQTKTQTAALNNILDVNSKSNG